MKIFRSVLASMLAFGFALIVPEAASAADNDHWSRIATHSYTAASPQAVKHRSATPMHTAQCSTGVVESIANNLPIRRGPYVDAGLITTGQKGYQYNCTGYYALGDRYTACDHSNANGWLELIIWLNDWDFMLGYTYMTCLKDV